MWPSRGSTRAGAATPVARASFDEPLAAPARRFDVGVAPSTVGESGGPPDR
jgi:hypothetical protein